LILNLGTTQTLTVAIIFYFIGDFLKNKLRLFDELCIPAPIIGGLLFAVLNFSLTKLGVVDINISAEYTTLFIYIFFSTIGLKISFKLIKSGGSLLFRYWLLCGVLVVFQNIIAIFASKALNINPLLGLMCGSISMEGGHGYAAAFGQTIQALGQGNAVDFGVTAATFGLIFGGILGGPVSRFLIERHSLCGKKHRTHASDNLHKSDCAVNLRSNSSWNINLSPLSFLEHLLVILICINLGDILSRLAYRLNGFIMPVVVSSMLMSVIFKNINDKVNFAELDTKFLNLLGDLSLGMFLTVSLMNIDLYELSGVLPIICSLVFLQVAFIILFGVFVCFRVLGRDYNAAVMISGMIGHGIGATPNAMANMATLTDKYGESPRAILVVPLVSSFLIDIIGVPCILYFINILS
jgi:ESS family glutamate:Na+ symporter